MYHWFNTENLLLMESVAVYNLLTLFLINCRDIKILNRCLHPMGDGQSLEQWGCAVSSEWGGLTPSSLCSYNWFHHIPGD